MNDGQRSIADNGNQTVSLIMDKLMGPMWICCEVTSAALTMLSLYIVVVLIIYTKKQNFRRVSIKSNSVAMSNLADSVHKSLNDLSNLKHSDRLNITGMARVPYLEQTSVDSNKSNSQLILSTSNDVQEYISTTLPLQRQKDSDRGTQLHKALVACSIVVVLRCVVEQCLLLMGDLQDPVCDYLAKAMIGSTALSLHCCHVFLWLRQLTFYSNPVLKPLRSKKLQALSYSAYAIMPITLATSLILFIVWRDYESVEGVCLPSKVNLSVYLPFGILVASTVTIQIMLSSLFLYPLLIHRQKRKVYDTKRSQHGETIGVSSIISTESRKKKGRRRDKLMDCIRRVFYGATVSITTDVIGGILSIFIPSYIPMFAYSVLYNLNVWLNIFCLLYTYANWRQMVFPWCFPAKPSKHFHDGRIFARSSIRNHRLTG